MGGGSALPVDLDNAYMLGKLIAENGWVLLNGGRNVGIMDASARGAQESGGLTIGILPDTDGHRASAYLDIQIVTGANDARNYYNVLSSDVVIACPGGTGTISEIALALKNAKHVVLLDFDVGTVFGKYESEGLLRQAKSPEEVIAQIRAILERR